MKKAKKATLLTMPKRRRTSAFPVESRILFLRHQRIILDADIAALYGVPVKRLNEQVKRNQERFPSDFMFQLTEKEHSALRSQFATSNKSRGGPVTKRVPLARLGRFFIKEGAVQAVRSKKSGQYFHKVMTNS